MIFLAPFSVGRHGVSQAPHTILAIRNGETYYHGKIAEIPVHHHDAITTSNNIQQVLKGRSNYLVLGGDHSITTGIIRARAEKEPVHLVMYDAHTDDYENEQVDKFYPLHSGNWLKILQEEGVLSGITMFTYRNHKLPSEYRQPIPKRGNVHLSIDIDVLSPTEINSATPYPEVGGCSLRTLLDDLSKLNFGSASVTADFVEYDPTRDSSQVGGIASSKIVEALLPIIAT